MYSGSAVATTAVAQGPAVGVPIIPEVTEETTQLVYVVEITAIQVTNG